MIILDSLDSISVNAPSAVAIGKFDGIHIGHRKLLSVILSARERGLQSVVFSFDPPPESFFTGKVIPQLMSREEKIRELDAMGVDALVLYPMNETTAAEEPADFVREYLAQRLQAKLVAAGSDLSFGKGGKGNLAFLQKEGPGYGIETVTVPKVEYEDEPISSSLIRRLIGRGDMEDAAICLGRPYSFFGEVVHGRAIGRGLGFPTANIRLGSEKVIPPLGVYFTRVICEGKTYGGLVNIGVRPTVSVEEDGKGESEAVLECHIPGISEDLYGKELQVELVSFHRPEQKFQSREALQKQVMEDLEAFRYFKV